MDWEGDFRLLLLNVAEGLTEENVKMIKYLCKDIISFDSDALSCVSLFESFENKGLINSSELTFLAEVLYRIHRHDLLKKLPGVKNRKDYEQNFLINQPHQNFTPFRIACFKLTGELTTSDFLILKNFCRNKLSTRNYNKSTDVFTLLDYLEQEDLVSDGDLEFLLSSLRQLDNQAPFKIFEQLRYGDHSFIFPNILPTHKKPAEPFRSLPAFNEQAPQASRPPFSHNQFHSFPYVQPAFPTNTGPFYQQATQSNQQQNYGQCGNSQKGSSINPGVQGDGTACRTFSESDQDLTKVIYPQYNSSAKSFMPNLEPSEVPVPYETAVNPASNENDSTLLKQTYSADESALITSTMSRTDNNSTTNEAIMESLENSHFHSLGSNRTEASSTSVDVTDSFLTHNLSDDPTSLQTSLKSIAIAKNFKAPIEKYPMNNSPAGLCLIINNSTFEGLVNIAEAERRIGMSGHDYPIPNVGLKNRTGSEHDVGKVRSLFHDFGFEVITHENLDSRAMQNVLVSAARKDHSRYDCFVLVIMSHGTLGSIYGVDGMAVSCAEIKRYFKPDSAPTLLNKPKIFIYQACQGEQTMDGHVAPIDDIESDGLPEMSTPSESDFLILYSSVPGYISYRSRSAGSFFIKSVVDNLRNLHRVEDVLSIMTNVNAELARERLNQMAMPVSTLRKKVFFKSARA